MEPEERLERLDQALGALDEASRRWPVLVEGLRDEVALRRLGVQGEILVYNRGSGMIALADRLRGREGVVVLFDWDRKGGQLTRLLKGQLAGSIRLELELRKELAQVSQVSCVEDLPSARRVLRQRLGHREDRPLSDA